MKCDIKLRTKILEKNPRRPVKAALLVQLRSDSAPAAKNQSRELSFHKYQPQTVRLDLNGAGQSRVITKALRKCRVLDQFSHN